MCKIFLPTYLEKGCFIKTFHAKQEKFVEYFHFVAIYFLRFYYSQRIYYNEINGQKVRIIWKLYGNLSIEQEFLYYWKWPKRYICIFHFEFVLSSCTLLGNGEFIRKEWTFYSFTDISLKNFNIFILLHMCLRQYVEILAFFP